MVSSEVERELLWFRGLDALLDLSRHFFSLGDLFGGHRVSQPTVCGHFLSKNSFVGTAPFVQGDLELGVAQNVVSHERIIRGVLTTVETRQFHLSQVVSLLGCSGQPSPRLQHRFGLRLWKSLEIREIV